MRNPPCLSVLTASMEAPRTLHKYLLGMQLRSNSNRPKSPSSNMNPGSSVVSVMVESHHSTIFKEYPFGGSVGLAAHVSLNKARPTSLTNLSDLKGLEREAVRAKEVSKKSRAHSVLFSSGRDSCWSLTAPTFLVMSFYLAICFFTENIQNYSEVEKKIIQLPIQNPIITSKKSSIFFSNVFQKWGK